MFVNKGWERRALGLPKGSVRAILALGIVGSALYVEITGGSGSELLKGLAFTAVAFYFGSRKEEKKEDK